ncbi:phosphoethanolamine transferase EptA [Cedecea sp. FDAARGOS_727]|uniref:phosphoethanolamine transferase EptA n=1 Tax=Cedecea sp. FDAARGOS_727 TaxID=2545798 RepID=UPI00143E1717|nr:phosphoethanolamine transferase EptA [Cedecea sp. FDAARGOS_727]QIX98128.1 phosphoethanolamine transferase EptA [Cedecea sp. FDAARGOS_727]
MDFLRKLRCNDAQFNLCCAFFFTLINSLFIRRSWQLIAPDSFHSWLFAASVPVVLFCAWLTIFSVINLPWLRKPVLVLLVIGCAASNYFMFTYGAVIDKNMMVNVFETDSQEAAALVTPQLIGWLTLAGVVPALALAVVKVAPARWWHTVLTRLVSILAGLLVIILVASVFYKDYASLFRNNKGVVKMVTPANYISAISRYSKERWFAGDQTLIKIGEDAQKGAIIRHQAKKTLVLLVVGEASRGENYSLGGYQRETNPQLKKQQVIYFQKASSCGTETAVSVPCMFSDMPRKSYDADVARHQEGVLDVLAHAGVNVLWRDNDGGCKGACDRIPHSDMTQWRLDLYCKDNACIDDVLLHRLDNVIDGLRHDTVIVLHLMGSHGPAYYQRYPENFRKFAPTCDSNQIQDCSRQALINTYDNTILHTDDVLSRTIDKLKQHQEKLNTALIYLADHGESLGENGIYLHGTPYMLAPSQQTHIPLLVWLSQDYQQNFAVDNVCLAQKAARDEVSQDNLFSTLLGMMNVNSSVYQKDMDILADCRRR